MLPNWTQKRRSTAAPFMAFKRWRRDVKVLKTVVVWVFIKTFLRKQAIAKWHSWCSWWQISADKRLLICQKGEKHCRNFWLNAGFVDFGWFAEIERRLHCGISKKMPTRTAERTDARCNEHGGAKASLWEARILT